MHDTADRSEHTAAPVSKWRSLDPKKRNLLIIVAVVAALVLIAVPLKTPNRSVAAYCQTYKEEKTRLASLPGDTWPAGVFNEEVNDASHIAASFGRLEKVAPDDIRPDITTLQIIYQKIHNDPSQALAASLGGIAAEDSAKKWTTKYCAVEY